MLDKARLTALTIIFLVELARILLLLVYVTTFASSGETNCNIAI